MVFIHGFPASSHLWHDVVREMPGGHRMVALDLLGFGRSDRPEACADHPLGVTAHADRVRALLDELAIGAACVVGHGMGGAVAQSLALTYRERVTRLCLVNSVAFDRWPARAARLARIACAVPAVGRALGAPLLAGLVHGSLLTGFADVEAGRRALDHYLHAFTTRLGVNTLVAQLLAMHDEGVGPLGLRLGELRLPTAVVWGRGDPFLPVALGERIRAAVPGASLDVIESARHFTPEDAPERVASVIRSLLGRPL